MNEELLQNLPAEYAALGDRRRVMLEAADELADLHKATTRLGDALESSGLPGSKWRSQDAALRLISRKLPDITVDRFITRLAEFSAGSGPDWLHGDADDLDRFHREVQAIYRLAARLSDILEHRAPASDGSRRTWSIEHAFSDPRTMAALDGVVEILEDFRALRPFMAPMAREEWKSAASSGGLETESTADGDWLRERDAGALAGAESHTRLRDFARATMGPASHHDDPKDRVLALLDRARSFLAPVIRRKPVAIALALVVALVLVTGVALLTLHGLRATGSPAAGSSPRPTTAATAVPAEATSAPVAHPTATRAPAPAPQLALTCKFNDSQGSSATLTIKNTGVIALTWQAGSNRQLTISPSRGQLSVGQTATAQVTPNSRRGWTNNTVTVTASNSARSASYNATCG